MDLTDPDPHILRQIYATEGRPTLCISTSSSYPEGQQKKNKKKVHSYRLKKRENKFSTIIQPEWAWDKNFGTPYLIYDHNIWHREVEFGPAITYGNGEGFSWVDLPPQTTLELIGLLD